MKTNLKPVVATAAIETICGLVLGWVVATAMGRNLHLYMRFVGFTVVVVFAAIGVWAYQTYLRPKFAHVEETETEVSE